MSLTGKGHDLQTALQPRSTIPASTPYDSDPHLSVAKNAEFVDRSITERSAASVRNAPHGHVGPAIACLEQGARRVPRFGTARACEK